MFPSRASPVFPILFSLVLFVLSSQIDAKLCPSSPDPYPITSTSLALTSTSPYLLTSWGRTNNPALYVYNVTTPYEIKELQVIIPPTGLACSGPDKLINNGAVDTFYPVYGKSLAVTDDFLFVGAPSSRLDGSPYNTFSYLDIYSFNSSSSKFYVSSQVVHRTSPYLGLLMAVSPNSPPSWLASIYDNEGTSVNLYRDPTVASARANPAKFEWGDNPNDARITFDIAAENMIIRGNVLVVVGTYLHEELGVCIPALQLSLFTSPSWSAPLPPIFLLPPFVEKTNGQYSPVDLYNYRVNCNSPSNQIVLDLIVPPASVGFSKASVAISVRAQQTVMFGSLDLLNKTTATRGLHYIADVVSTVPSSSTPASTYKSFGLSVSFPNTDASRLLVAHESAVLLYDLKNYGIDTVLNVNKVGTKLELNSFIYQAPNRLQRNIAIEGKKRVFREAQAKSDLILILQTPSSDLPNTEIIVLPSTPAGYYWNSFVQENGEPGALEKCPRGRNKTIAGFAACQPCPWDTYQPDEGAATCIACSKDQYCPSGSVKAYPIGEGVIKAEAEEENKFEKDEFREAFEALLIEAIFGIHTPVLFVFLGFSGVVIILSLISAFAQDPYSRWTKRVLSVFVVFHESASSNLKEKETHERRSRRQRRAEQVAPEGAKPSNNHAITASEVFEAYAFCTFILFAGGALVYIFVYLISYDPYNYHKNTLKQNIFRETYPVYIGTDEKEASESLYIMQNTGFEIEVSLIGLSAPDGLCKKEGIVSSSSFSFDGCILPTFGSCVDNYQVEYGKDDSGNEDTNICNIVISVPKGTTLAPSSSLQFSFLSLYSIQAMKIEFSYNNNTKEIMDIAPQNLQNSRNLPMVVPKAFEEIILYPPVVGDDAFISHSLHRSYIMSFVAQRNQRKGQWQPIFDSEWTIGLHSSLPGNFTLTNERHFLYDDSSDRFNVQLDFVQSSYYTLNSAQRLVGKDQVVLTIALGLLAIYHMIHFCELIVEALVAAVIKKCLKKKKGKDVEAKYNPSNGGTPKTTGRPQSILKQQPTASNINNNNNNNNNTANQSEIQMAQNV